MDKYLVTYRSDAFQTNVIKTVEAHHNDVDAPFVMLIDDDSTPRLIILASSLESVELLPADEPPASEQATA